MSNREWTVEQLESVIREAGRDQYGSTDPLARMVLDARAEVAALKSELIKYERWSREANFSKIPSEQREAYKAGHMDGFTAPIHEVWELQAQIEALEWFASRFDKAEEFKRMWEIIKPRIADLIDQKKQLQNA